MLEDPSEAGTGVREAGVMAGALHDLVAQQKPSHRAIPGLLDGLRHIKAHIDPLLSSKREDDNIEPFRASGS